MIGDNMKASAAQPSPGQLITQAMCDAAAEMERLRQSRKALLEALTEAEELIAHRCGFPGDATGYQSTLCKIRAVIKKESTS